MAFKRRTKKLADLEIVETSGVDHPAHLHEGWLVQKSALDTVLDEVVSPTTPDTGELMELEETIETPAEDAETLPVEAEVTKADDSDEVRKELDHLRKELDIAKAKAEAMEDERAMEKAQTRVTDWGILPEVNPVDFAPVLRSLRAAAPEETTKIEEIFDACTKALAEAGIFTEIGTDAETESTDAWDQIESLAKAKVDGGTVNDLPAAITAVATENPDLYNRYLSEKGA